MPLLHIKDIDGQANWALWEITESHDELTVTDLCENQKNELAQITNERKRLEWLASRKALQQLFINNKIVIKSILKDGDGKPFLDGLQHQISLAHSFPYAVAIFNKEKPAGIDMERIQPKIFKISNKFLNDAEKATVAGDIAKMTVIWCAKEALYKLYGKRKLIFKENLFIDHFELQVEGDIAGKIAIEDIEQKIPMHYLVQGDFVICYTK